MNRGTLRIGAGAGFSGDRIDPAVHLAEHGDLDYLVFECLGERTVALATLRKGRDPDGGYDPLLRERIEAVLFPALKQGTTLITNGGAANPMGAATAIAQCLKQRSLPRRVTIGAVLGDDVLEAVTDLDPLIWENGRYISDEPEDLLSAHAYLGADALLPALGSGVDILITGRVADPSMFLAPMIHKFGWDPADAGLLGAGTAVGHLLECAGQLTGGYFADPVTKPVSGLADLGFPYADIHQNGSAVLGKVKGTGGILDRRTCREQLLYEVHDPSRYLTPDVTADFSQATFEELGRDEVAVAGATGSARPDELKVTLGFRGGWVGEGQITYAGPRAVERAELAAEIVSTRLREVHRLDDPVNVELIGTGSAFRNMSRPSTPPDEVRLRVSGRVPHAEQAEMIGREVEGLYTNGPAGGGGARRTVSEVLATRSTSIPRSKVAITTSYLEV